MTSKIRNRDHWMPNVVLSLLAPHSLDLNVLGFLILFYFALLAVVSFLNLKTTVACSVHLTPLPFGQPALAVSFL